RASRRARPAVLFGRDTRLSGPLLAGALAAGLLAEGIDVLDGGVLPTPAVAWLTRKLGLSLGAVFSASHNPFEDNGIKLFSPEGLKLPDATESAIEAALERAAGNGNGMGDAGARLRGAALGRLEHRPELADIYVEDLVSAFRRRLSLAGRTLVLDCAHGATSALAPRIFGRLGADLIVLNDAPDGVNINDRCGALFPGAMSKRVWQADAYAGFSFDGDGDRLILTDETGAVRDGDYVLYLTATHLAGRRRLPQRTVATTVMANLGLTVALRDAGIASVVTPVGDRHVLDAMLERGLSLGGEQSGHVIFLDEATSGDGIITALRVLEATLAEPRPISEACRGLAKFPQVLVNVPVRSKPPLSSLPEVQEEVARIQTALAGRGRLLLRYSGTEPLVRIMLEGDDPAAIRELADGLARLLARRIGP
ncbi:MAG: phosphoglucosamine mutase, partial [Planctomycetes bacterium]|nr:phosphoglucosamine mutase [Planctomycetota bacterium]